MERHSSPEFLFSCEHAGNDIPENYLSLFEGADEILNSHRGWDPGAAELAKMLSEETQSGLFIYPYTRLFVEINRSVGHPKLFSEFTRNLPRSEKQKIINTFYHPYRNQVIEAIKKNISQDVSTVHIGVHTFTPVLNQKERDIDIGLLYDPQRKREQLFCRNWRIPLNQTPPEFRVRMNQPYKGISDGFTTYLRQLFDEKYYLGIELEVNQKLLQQKDRWRTVCSNITDSLLSFRNQ